MKKRVIASLLVSALSAALAWGGGGRDAGAASSSAPASQVKVTPTMTELGLPLKTPITVRYWVPMNASEVQVIKSYAEKTMWQDMEKISNIRIEFEHPSVVSSEAFNLLLASGDLPDIIQYDNNFKNVIGGLDGLIDDKVILDLTSQVNNNMPNLKKILNANPVNVDALMKTGGGRYWSIPKIYIGEVCWAGPVVRSDLLAKFNLKVPETIDDWYNMLRTFKANGVVAPMSFLRDPALVDYSLFIGSFGVTKNFYVETDGKIHYGPIEEGYRQFLTTFNKWYSEGLIDPEFAALDNNSYRAKATNGTYGAFSTSSGNVVAFQTEIQRNSPGTTLVPTPYPKLTPGQTVRFRQQGEDVRPYFSAISAQSKYANEICKMFDYMFSEEGKFLMTFGHEGEAYTLNAEGRPVATDFLTKNPSALFADLITKYCGRNSVFWTDPYEVVFLDYMGAQINLRRTWDGSANYSGMRPSFELPAADTLAVNRIMADVRTYVDEMLVKFIMGQEPLSNFDAYVQNIKKMGIDDALARHNAAFGKFTAK